MRTSEKSEYYCRFPADVGIPKGWQRADPDWFRKPNYGDYYVSALGLPAAYKGTVLLSRPERVIIMKLPEET